MKPTFSTTPRPTSLPKSAQMLRKTVAANFAPKPAPTPTVTQTILRAELNNHNMGVVKTAIQDGAKPAEVRKMVAEMQSPKSGRAVSVAAEQRAQASKLNRLG